MNTTIQRRLLTILVTAFTAFAVSAQTDQKYYDLPNFHQVGRNLFRGAQPGSSGLTRLHQLGVKTVVNLRDDDERASGEELPAKSAGLQYFNIPLSGLARPHDEQVRRVLAIIYAPENQPVFVHCRRGADRTGTIIAIYRMEHDGWTAEKAEAEANRFGMGFWQRDMKGYIRDFSKPQQKQNTKPETPQQDAGLTK